MLTTDQFTLIVDLTEPFATTTNAREALIVSIFAGADSKPDIDLSGAPLEFCQRLVAALRDFGEIEPGKPALVALLTHLRPQVGVDKQAQIDALIADLLTPTEPAAHAHVFISYSRSNREFVTRLTADLQREGIAVWIDHSGLEPGTSNWESALRTAIRDAYAVLYIGAPDAARSNYVLAELEIAAMYSLPVIPLWAEGDDGRWADCAPMVLVKAQYLDLRDDGYDTNLPELTKRLLALQGERIEPPKTPFQGINPYKGLRAFTQEDARFYFGRDAESAALVDLLSERRFVAVMGASGSGKSSLVMAGVLPKLAPKEWTVIRIVPGDRPLLTLANALGAAVGMGVTDVEKDLKRPDGLGLHLYGGRIAARAKTPRVLLFIDQFEEVFTRPQSEDERRTFLDALVKAASEPDGALTILLTMRADFYDRPLAYPDLLEQMRDPLLLPAMPDDNLRDAIVKPAEAVGLEFEDGLVGDLLFEVRGEVGALPLLQFTLDLLYRQCIDADNGETLTLAAYRALGGVKGALANYAEAEFRKLAADEQRLARALFLRLIEPGATEQDTTRRRALQTELTLPDPGETERLADVTRAFVEARLLTTDRVGEDETLEVAHEALLREWERLQGWLSEARGDVLLGKKINADAAAWVRAERPADYGAFYRAGVLADAEAWAARSTPSRDEADFIAASRRAEQLQIEAEERRKEELRQAAERAELASKEAQRSADRAERQRRRARTAVGVAGAIIVVAIVAGILATLQINNANERVAGVEPTLAAADTRVAGVEPTLAAADAQLSRATATLGYVQVQGTEVAAQATYFDIEQARIGTLSAGAVVIPPGTLTPELLLPTLTGVAQLHLWQPRIIEDDFGVEMVEVPPGCFMMGSVAGGDEQPIHEQCFSEPFFIDRFEVTYEQYQRIAGTAPPSEFTEDLMPVNSITWFDARDYCRMRAAELPTEAQWEYAARGPDSLTYPWGNEFDPEIAVYNRPSSAGPLPVMDAEGEPLRSAGASWVGAVDLAGNVWEWTNTRYDDLDYSEQLFDFQGLYPYPYATDDGRESDETLEEFEERVPLYTLRVLRGGGFFNTVSVLRGAARNRIDALVGDDNLGFRCARS